MFFLGGKRERHHSTATNVTSQGSNGTRGRITSIIIESLAFLVSPPKRRNDKGRLESSFSELYFPPPRAWRSKPRRVKLWWNETGGGSFWLVKFLKKNPWHWCKKWANLQQKWFFCWSVLVMLLEMNQKNVEMPLSLICSNQILSRYKFITGIFLGASQYLLIFHRFHLAGQSCRGILGGSSHLVTSYWPPFISHETAI